jgi:hypothetical protein
MIDHDSVDGPTWAPCQFSVLYEPASLLPKSAIEEWEVLEPKDIFSHRPEFEQVN